MDASTEYLPTLVSIDTFYKSYIVDHRYLLAIGWPSHYFLEKILFTEGDALPIKDQA